MLAPWAEDGFEYPATLEKLEGDSCTVAWDDGGLTCRDVPATARFQVILMIFKVILGIDTLKFKIKRFLRLEELESFLKGALRRIDELRWLGLSWP